MCKNIEHRGLARKPVHNRPEVKGQQDTTAQQ